MWLRTWFASLAYVLICALRPIGLADTSFAEAICGANRLRLLRVDAPQRIGVRRIAIASGCRPLPIEARGKMIARRRADADLPGLIGVAASPRNAVSPPATTGALVSAPDE